MTQVNFSILHTRDVSRELHFDRHALSLFNNRLTITTRAAPYAPRSHDLCRKFVASPDHAPLAAAPFVAAVWPRKKAASDVISLRMSRVSSAQICMRIAFGCRN